MVAVRVTRVRASAVTLIGVVCVVTGSVVGSLRMFDVFGTSGMAMSGMDDDMLHGMPLADMPEMWVAGAGILLTLAGALLRTPPRRPAPVRAATRTAGRRGLLACLATAALTIDVSKTSTLGFVIPGMRTEYGLDPTTAAMLAVAGLSGTAGGALLVSRLADRVGRRASYLIATLGFTATSMCAGMPTFTGNVVMCFLMGIAVGGLAPLLITVLTDLFPGGARGPVVAGLSVVATAIGYLVAAGSALWLEPTYGWRVLWLIGAPTGLLLATLTVTRAGTPGQHAGGERVTGPLCAAGYRARHVHRPPAMALRRDDRSADVRADDLGAHLREGRRPVAPPRRTPC